MTKSDMKVAVVIPAYNEGRTIVDVAERARRACPWVIVVDDGSGDSTAERLKDMPIILLRNERNQGKAASLEKGTRFALKHDADAVITLDGDGQHQPEDVPRFIAAALKEPGRLIIGTREGKREHAPFMRHLANRIADFWISWAAGYPFKDTQSGFRLYPAEMLRRVRLSSSHNKRFVYESAFLIEAARRFHGAFARVAIQSIYIPGARPSHYRPVADTAKIVLMVAWKLISRGGYPQGLLRSLGIVPSSPPAEKHPQEANLSERPL